MKKKKKNSLKVGDDSNALPYGATYIGCYNDNKTRDLSEFSAQLGTATTIENCIELGYKNYMQYVGLQNGLVLAIFILFIYIKILPIC